LIKFGKKAIAAYPNIPVDQVKRIQFLDNLGSVALGQTYSFPCGIQIVGSSQSDQEIEF
jgi:hypothetical protein